MTLYWAVYGVVSALFILVLYARWRYRGQLARARAALEAAGRPAPTRGDRLKDALRVMGDDLDTI